MCKRCYDVHWYFLNKDKEKRRCSEYYKKNKKKRLKEGKQWRKENKERLKNYYKERLQNPQHRLTNLLRARLRSALVRNQKAGSAVQDLGCSMGEFKVYLESKFYNNSHTQEVMNWDNFGIRWELDHVKELCLFDLTDRKQFLDACHYTNLQPLWKEDHIVKTANFNAQK